MINVKSASEIVKMQKAGEVVALAHQAVKENIAVGMTTEELDKIVFDVIKAKGAIPSFLNYNGFPKSICTSINDTIIHGIPSADVVLCDGDIVGVDIGAYLDGYHGDSAATYAVGNVSDDAKKLIEVTEQAFFKGIEFAREGYRIGDVSANVQVWAESFGYSVVREFIGHGVGRNLHEAPDVPNYGKPGKGPRMVCGMTFAVEPMINEGKKEVKMLGDGWTVKTADGSLSAHYEHTIAVTKNEPLLLTVLR